MSEEVWTALPEVYDRRLKMHQSAYIAQEWQPVNYASILWTDKAAYEHKLGALVEAEKKKLHATVEALRERGLLNETQGATQDPRLVVTIKCDINPCPL